MIEASGNKDPKICQIPELDPFHPSIMQYIRDTKDPDCHGTTYGRLWNGTLKFVGKTSGPSSRMFGRWSRTMTLLDPGQLVYSLISSCSNTGSIMDDPYWISRENSFRSDRAIIQYK